MHSIVILRRCTVSALNISFLVYKLKVHKGHKSLSIYSTHEKKKVTIDACTIHFQNGYKYVNENMKIQTLNGGPYISKYVPTLTTRVH